jgi:hypothetical protein
VTPNAKGNLMKYSMNRFRKYAFCGLFGLQLVCFALFLHPMDPVDFLVSVATDPYATFNNQNGSWATWFFGLGSLLIVAACAGVITSLLHIAVNNQKSTFRLKHAR